MGYRLTKIYTRTGDSGTTSLDGKTRLLKNALRIEAIGTLDELNCAIGLTLVYTQHVSVKDTLTTIQHTLFDLGGELCLPDRVVITPEKTTQLESIIDTWNQELPPLKDFILPSGNLASTHCHMARAICRRAERRLVSLKQEEMISNDILRYINRLSDLLFVGARILAKEDNCIETLWEHTRQTK